MDQELKDELKGIREGLLWIADQTKVQYRTFLSSNEASNVFLYRNEIIK